MGNFIKNNALKVVISGFLTWIYAVALLVVTIAKPIYLTTVTSWLLSNLGLATLFSVGMSSLLSGISIPLILCLSFGVMAILEKIPLVISRLMMEIWRVITRNQNKVIAAAVITYVYVILAMLFVSIFPVTSQVLMLWLLSGLGTTVVSSLTIFYLYMALSIPVWITSFATMVIAQNMYYKIRSLVHEIKKFGLFNLIMVRFSSLRSYHVTPNNRPAEAAATAPNVRSLTLANFAKIVSSCRELSVVEKNKLTRIVSLSSVMVSCKQSESLEDRAARIQAQIRESGDSMDAEITQLGLNCPISFSIPQDPVRVYGAGYAPSHHIRYERESVEGWLKCHSKAPTDPTGSAPLTSPEVVQDQYWAHYIDLYLSWKESKHVVIRLSESVEQRKDRIEVLGKHPEILAKRELRKFQLTCARSGEILNDPVLIYPTADDRRNSTNGERCNRSALIAQDGGFVHPVAKLVVSPSEVIRDFAYELEIDAYLTAKEDLYASELAELVKELVTLSEPIQIRRESANPEERARRLAAIGSSRMAVFGSLEIDVSLQNNEYVDTYLTAVENGVKIKSVNVAERGRLILKLEQFIETLEEYRKSISHVTLADSLLEVLERFCLTSSTFQQEYAELDLMCVLSQDMLRSPVKIGDVKHHSRFEREYCTEYVAEEVAKVAEAKRQGYLYNSNLTHPLTKERMLNLTVSDDLGRALAIDSYLTQKINRCRVFLAHISILMEDHQQYRIGWDKLFAELERMINEMDDVNGVRVAAGAERYVVKPHPLVSISPADMVDDDAGMRPEGFPPSHGAAAAGAGSFIPQLRHPVRTNRGAAGGAAAGAAAGAGPSITESSNPEHRHARWVRLLDLDAVTQEMLVEGNLLCAQSEEVLIDPVTIDASPGQTFNREAALGLVSGCTPNPREAARIDAYLSRIETLYALPVLQPPSPSAPLRASHYR